MARTSALLMAGAIGGGGNKVVVEHLARLSLDDLGGRPIVASSPEDDAWLARVMADEVMDAVTNREGGCGSATWYSDSIRKAVEIASMMHPELTDDAIAVESSEGRYASASDARCVLFAALAITSVNVPVMENARYALEQFRTHLATGSFVPKPYGTRGPSIEANLRRFNILVEGCGSSIALARRLLDAEFTVGSLRKVAARHGIAMGHAELSNSIVRGSVLLGPKVGAFYQNLRGNHAALTADLWFCRTFARLTGTMRKPDDGGERVARLSEALGADRAERRRLGREGVVLDLRRLSSAPPEDLARLAGRLVLSWERRRRALVRGGMSNASAATEKSRLRWPGAAVALEEFLTKPPEQPTNGSQRAWMRSIVDAAVEILGREGIVTTPADLQATLWYPEKDLYDALAGRPLGLLNKTFDEAFRACALKEGIDDQAIDDRLEGRAGRRGSHRVSRDGERRKSARFLRGAGAHAPQLGETGRDCGAARAGP